MLGSRWVMPPPSPRTLTPLPCAPPECLVHRTGSPGPSAASPVKVSLSSSCLPGQARLGLSRPDLGQPAHPWRRSLRAEAELEPVQGVGGARAGRRGQPESCGSAGLVQGVAPLAGEDGGGRSLSSPHHPRGTHWDPAGTRSALTSQPLDGLGLVPSLPFLASLLPASSSPLLSPPRAPPGRWALVPRDALAPSWLALMSLAEH